jgi:hypothetical protein
MIEADPATPLSAGGLLARMVALARLSERTQPPDRRHLMVEKALRRMLLASRMAERLGLAAPDSPLVHAVLREATLGCLDCTEWRRCRQWLDGRLPDEDYRDFCPNEGLFSVLPRRNDRTPPRDPG